MRVILISVLLATAPTLPSPAYPDEPPPSQRAAEGQTAPMFGLALDAGFPDGFAASAVFRPWLPLRVEAGLTYNVLGFGLRAGASVAPFALRVAPILHLEVGHTFGADASGLAQRFGTLNATEVLLLRDVGYDYASAQLGVEIRASERTAFFARAGLVYFTTTVKNFQAAVRATSPGSTFIADDPTVRGTAPTASLGVMLFFF